MLNGDLKYQNVLRIIEEMARGSFSNECTKKGKIITDEDPTEFYRHFMDNYSCLFTVPDIFNVEYLNRENTMTIEEFDSSVKLEYEDIFQNISLNAKYGKEYYEKYKYLLEIFHEYFTMISVVSKNFKEEDYESLFSIIGFNFFGFKHFTSIEDINLFLEVYEYTYSNFINKNLFSSYKEYVSKKYGDELNRD